MTVTAMVVCQSKEQDTQIPEQGKVTLTAVTGGSEEAEKYFAYTPYAYFQMGILNEEAFKQFEPGKTYRVTFEQVD